MKYFNMVLSLLLVGLLGCSDDSLLGAFSDEEDAASLTMPFEEDLSGAAGKNLPPGQVEPVLSLPTGDSPEGIILDDYGNIYISNRRTDATGRVSEILKITPGGTVSVFATLPTAPPEATGALGLAIDPSGNLSVAHVTGDPATHGVWRIRRNGGDMERLAGSQNMIFPNAMTFDDRGNLYVTDSFGGGIWRYGKDREFSLWVQHALLESVEVPGAPFPIPGANGIAFFPPNKLYVANTSQFSVIRIVMAPDGSANEAELVVQGLELFSIDGLAVDVHENIYGVLAASNAEETGTPINPVPPLVKVNPGTGDVTVILGDDEAFDAPTSLAFGRGRRDYKSVFIANSALFGPLTNGPGAGVVQVGVEGAGFPMRIVGRGADDSRIPFTGAFTSTADPDEGAIACVGAAGVLLPRKANVTGRAYYLDETTGYFTTTECQAQTDGTMASAGDWRFIGTGSHMVMGTWTATMQADGSFTGRTVIKDGIGQFAGATGWTRFSGQMDSATGRSEFTGSGLISRPRAVSAMGMVAETTNMSESGSISCQDRNGNTTTFRPTRQVVGVGLATYMGAYSFVSTNERCINDGGVSTLYGTWSQTNAQGDVVRGTHAVQIGVVEPWPNDIIITGGEGQFEGVTGWMDGVIYWDEKRAPAKGVLFMPR